MDFSMTEVKDFQSVPTGDPIWKRPLKGLATVAVVILLTFLSSILAGILLGANETVNAGQLTLNAGATLVYLVIAYLAGKLYELKPMPTYNFLVLAGVLSIIMAFVPGMLVMLMIVPILKKLKLV
jgi:hypothetical protein